MKTIKLLTLVVCAMLVMTACGGGKKNAEVTGADGTVYSSYQEACRAQDFEAAYKIIEISDGTEQDKEYVFNSEMLYLASLNTEDATNRIVYLLSEYAIQGTPVSVGDKYTDNSPGHDKYLAAKEYISGISRFNDRCNSVLNIAISQNNKFLASKIVGLYKEIVEFKETERGKGMFGEPPVLTILGFSNHTQEAAKRKLQDTME